jgi:signal transduction histidine kinase
MTEQSTVGLQGRLDALMQAVVATASDLQLRDTLQRVLEAATTLVDAKYGALGVFDETHELIEFIPYGMTADQLGGITHWPEGRGLIGLLAHERQPVRLDHMDEHPAAVGLPQGHPPMDGFLGVPVRVGDETFGNLYLTEKRSGAFTDEDARVVKMFAAAAGTAIRNARLYETVARREAWTRAGAEIDMASLVGASADEILGLVARSARELSGAAAALVATPDASGRLRVRVIDVLAPDSSIVDQGDEIPPESSLQLVVQSGASSIVSPDPVFFNRPTLSVALRTSDRLLGVLSLADVPDFQIDALVGELVQDFAARAAITLVLSEANATRRELAISLDRERIARDLHDFVIQRLFATGMVLDAISGREDVPEKVRTRVGRAVDDLDETVREIRQAIFNLTDTPDSQTVRSRASREVRSASESLGFTPSLRFEGAVDASIVGDLADTFIAALREALSNAARHANASTINVRLSVHDGRASLTVEDDGKGIGVTSRRSGLANLRARAELVGGSFETKTRSDGTGTRVELLLPIPDNTSTI